MIKSHLLYQLSYVPVGMKIIEIHPLSVNTLVTKGVEPSTSAFGGQRSIQLSYVTERSPKRRCNIWGG